MANLTVNVLAAEENAFYVKRDDEYSVIVSPSQPRYVYYKFTESDSDSIIIEVDSEDDVCLTVSVQDSSVSNNDELINISRLYMCKENWEKQFSYIFVRHSHY